MQGTRLGLPAVTSRRVRTRDCPRVVSRPSDGRKRCARRCGLSGTNRQEELSMRTRQHSAARFAALALVGVAASVLAGSGPAEAAFPGANGAIAFTSDRGGDLEIYVMGADGSHVTQLTHDPAPDLRPAWSPDGSMIAFDSSRDGDFEVYTMDSDGSAVTALTESPFFDGMPAWLLELQQDRVHELPGPRPSALRHEQSTALARTRGSTTHRAPTAEPAAAGRYEDRVAQRGRGQQRHLRHHRRGRQRALPGLRTIRAADGAPNGCPMEVGSCLPERLGRQR